MTTATLTPTTPASTRVQFTHRGVRCTWSARSRHGWTTWDTQGHHGYEPRRITLTAAVWHATAEQVKAAIDRWIDG